MQLYEGCLYHIVNRSNNSEQIYLCDYHYDFFLSKIFKLKSYLDIHAFCLMPTHFHILVRITTDDQDPLRRKIGDILSGYTKAINKHYGRTGSLFQQHTKAHLILNEKHLMSCFHYIHRNPLEAGLVNRLEDWKHSSYRVYIGLEVNFYLTIREMLDRFSCIEEFIKASNSRNL